MFCQSENENGSKNLLPFYNLVKNPYGTRPFRLGVFLNEGSRYALRCEKGSFLKVMGGRMKKQIKDDKKTIFFKK